MTFSEVMLLVPVMMMMMMMIIIIIIFSLFQRKNGEMDQESLSLTEQVLAANPDFSTLWNFRREIFLHMKDEKYVL